ncbi:MAG: hypothetical protein ABFQ95_05235 [Pseudomonadota bacterium]
MTKNNTATETKKDLVKAPTSNKSSKKALTTKIETTNEPDPFVDFKRWLIKYRLSNGLEECLSIPTSDYKRLRQLFSTAKWIKGVDFFEFDSDTHRILIQSSQLRFCQFLFEPPCFEDPEDPDAEATDSYPVKIYFINDPTPMVLHVEEDQSNPNDEDDWGEMQEFIFYALHAHSDEDWLNITDHYGETAFFRAADVAMIEIPLQVFANDD